jgi:hypothetical protein
MDLSKVKKIEFDNAGIEQKNSEIIRVAEIYCPIQ